MTTAMAFRLILSLFICHDNNKQVKLRLTTTSHAKTALSKTPSLKFPDLLQLLDWLNWFNELKLLYLLKLLTLLKLANLA